MELIDSNESCARCNFAAKEKIFFKKEKELLTLIGKDVCVMIISPRGKNHIHMAPQI